MTPLLLRVLRGILKDDGHSVLSSINKEEALANVNQNYLELDLIILDLYIPTKQGEAPDEENGFEILKNTKNKYPSINVIILTAHDDVELAVRCMKGGAYDFLTKPLRLEVLRRRLQDISALIEKEKT